MTESRMNTHHVEVQLAHLEEQIGSLKGSFEAEKISSKEAIAAAFKAAETATAAALQAQKESATKSETNAEKQLEMHNGLIRKMDALVASFPNKDYVNSQLSARDQRLGVLDRQVARAYGLTAGAIALAGVAAAVAAATSF